MPRIAVVGSANMDLVVHCERLPHCGETLVGRDFATHPGGKGANQAVAAGRLADPLLLREAEEEGAGGGGQANTQVFFVGCLGKDEHGDQLKQSLVQAHVDTTWIKKTNLAPTGTALITVADSGENTIVIDPGANSLLDPDHVLQALKEIRPDVTLVQLEIPEVSVYACQGHGTLILDPAPARILDSDFMAGVDLITPNESETLYLTGIMPIDEFSQYRAAQSLLEKGPQAAAITLGANGCYYIDREGHFHLPVQQVEAVDTTGAGDAFAGALAVAVAEGQGTKHALDFAMKCAAVSVTRPGAQSGMTMRRDVQD